MEELMFILDDIENNVKSFLDTPKAEQDEARSQKEPSRSPEHSHEQDAKSSLFFPHRSGNPSSSIAYCSQTV